MVCSSLTFGKFTHVKALMLKALVFDAYGTLFDVHSVARRCESFWPGKGDLQSQAWRAKQLEYTWQRSLMQRYVPFSQVTRDALADACAALGLPVDLYDERFTTAEAAHRGATDLDAGAATVLLEDFFTSRRRAG